MITKTFHWFCNPQTQNQHQQNPSKIQKPHCQKDITIDLKLAVLYQVKHLIQTHITTQANSFITLYCHSSLFAPPSPTVRPPPPFLPSKVGYPIKRIKSQCHTYKSHLSPCHEPSPLILCCFPQTPLWIKCKVPSLLHWMRLTRWQEKKRRAPSAKSQWKADRHWHVSRSRRGNSYVYMVFVQICVIFSTSGMIDGSAAIRSGVVSAKVASLCLVHCARRQRECLVGCRCW